MRSTVDRITSISNLISIRKKNRLPTYCAFIDFKKAYDHVDRDILWRHLESYGIGGEMFNAIKSSYKSVSACVRLNGISSNWFDIHTGFRQGCSLSLTLFNLFLNDLAFEVIAVGERIDIGGMKLSDNKNGLQSMLDVLSVWCKANEMSVNSQKSNNVNFRPPSINRTNVKFHFGDEAISVVNRYTYLV